MTQQQEQPQDEYQQVQYPREQQTGGKYNGLEENLCTILARSSIGNPNRADAYNPHAGRIINLNNHKFPVLNLVQMSATNLYQNVVLSLFWNVNAHSLVYTIQGRARVQVVNNHGKAVFDGVLRPGQLLVIPHNYLVLKKAEREGFQIHCVQDKLKLHSEPYRRKELNPPCIACGCDC
ncbi:hypothetical protein ABZP36_022466 [Zizania latifolia]